LGKDESGLRDAIDNVDLQTDDLIKKAIRDTISITSADDFASKESLDNIKNILETLDEKVAVENLEVVWKISERCEKWDALEKLRKNLRDRLNKEISRLK